LHLTIHPMRSRLFLKKEQNPKDLSEIQDTCY
jgi:hypothetical protein